MSSAAVVSDSSSLADTGSNLFGGLFAALFVLLAGAGVLLFARRRTLRA